MKIKVKNLGAIKNGEIDLSKDFILFTGPNNSGKSYMSYLVYNLFRMDTRIHPTSDPEKEFERLRGLLLSDNSWNSFAYNLDEEVNNIENDLGVEEKLSELLSSKTLKKKILESSKFNEEIEKIIGKHLIKLSKNEEVEKIWSERISDNVRDALSYIFASDNVVPEIEIQANPKFTSIHSLRNNLYRLFAYYSDEISVDKLSDLIKFMIEVNDFYILNFCYGARNIKTFFPAERTALTMVSREITKNKSVERDEILKAVMDGKKNRKELELDFKNKFTRYPSAISHYINWVHDLDQITRHTSPFSKLADEVEKLMLKGGVSTNSYGNIHFTPENSKKELELHVSSSLVKSLSGLILYLRHQAEDGDLIMIDEPELNLHPDSQILVARALAKIHNAGFKLIISTHSDYIIKELSNLIMLNRKQDDAELLADFQCEKDMLLDKEKMAVYFFNNQTIEELEIAETGIAIPTINDSIDNINTRMEQIYYRTFEDEEELA
ncbi:MAG: putative ATPase [Bacteroidia bacterium]|jgi:predicted ATPase